MDSNNVWKKKVNCSKEQLQLRTFTFWLVNPHCLTNQNVNNPTYRNVAIINTLQLEAHFRMYRMLMKGEFNVYIYCDLLRKSWFHLLGFLT